MSGTITLCFVNAAAPQEALSGPIRQGVMAALNVAGTCGPAHGTSHSPFSKQTIEVTGEPCASMAAHKSFKTSERLAPFAIFSSVRFSAANRDSACVGVAGFSGCFTTLGEALPSVSWYGDSGKLFIAIVRRVSQAHSGRQ